jgi:hypothetical protein
MKGEQKDACEKDAKAKHDQAKASISKQYAQRKDADRPKRSATSGETRSETRSETRRENRSAAGGTK